SFRARSSRKRRGRLRHDGLRRGTQTLRHRGPQGSQHPPSYPCGSRGAEADLPLGLAQKLANLAEQLFRIRRLLKKCRRPGVERWSFSDTPLLSRDDDHRNGTESRKSLKSFQDGQTPAARQTEIENDQIGRILARFRERTDCV